MYSIDLKGGIFSILIIRKEGKRTGGGTLTKSHSKTVTHGKIIPLRKLK